jgi:hypothetical protein
LFSLAIDSKLPACDLVAIRVKDVYNKNRVRDRASVVLRRGRMSGSKRTSGSWLIPRSGSTERGS